MRILFITRKFPPSVGGMEVFSEELWNAMTKKCPDAALLKPQPAIVGRPSVIQLGWFLVRAGFAILQRAGRFDVILLGDAVLTPLAWLAKLRTRGATTTVVTAHGNDVYFAKRNRLSSRIYRRILQSCSRAADLLIANSSDTQRAAVELGFHDTMRIPLATNLEPDFAVPEDRAQAILFAGRLIHYKGLRWFIDFVLPLVRPTVQLLVAGPPWDAAELSAVENCPRARYLGSLARADLPHLRAGVLACVMPNLPAQLTSQNEGFGLSALESPAVGTPVVATDVGGLTEAVIDGVTGFLVAPMDADSFAARINEIAAWQPMQRTLFATRAREAISEHFTWDRVATDYLQQFQRLVSLRHADRHHAI